MNTRCPHCDARQLFWNGYFLEWYCIYCGYILYHTTLDLTLDKSGRRINPDRGALGVTETQYG